MAFTSYNFISFRMHPMLLEVPFNTPGSVSCCRLIMAKGHITGSGQYTIPRLKLEAAFHAVKPVSSVKKELKLSNVPCFFLIDSIFILQSMRANIKISTQSVATNFKTDESARLEFLRH